MHPISFQATLNEKCARASFFDLSVCTNRGGDRTERRGVRFLARAFSGGQSTVYYLDLFQRDKANMAVRGLAVANAARVVH